MSNKITKQGYTAIVTEYQETKDELLISEMLDYMGTTIGKLVTKQLERVKTLGYTRQDVESLALEMLWVCMETYDGSRGADFLAYYNQRLRWTVNDKLIERKGSLADEHYQKSISLDTSMTDHHSDDQFNDGQILLQGDHLLTTDLELDKINYSETFPKLLKAYEATHEKAPVYMREAIFNDVEIITLVMKAIEDNRLSKQDINEFLYEQLPDMDKRSIRKRKENAIKRFGKFLEENL